MILLASGSPRRAELLRRQGIDFHVMPSHIDESVFEAESPPDYVLRLAQSKALAGITGIAKQDEHYKLVLAADTSVAIDDQILGKPESFDHFEHMMNTLSGRSHQVFTGVAVVSSRSISENSSGLEINSQDAPLSEESLVVQTTVTFDQLSKQKIQAYWHSGEPQDKAGGYGIQGLAEEFVTRIDGSYSNVVGLPVFETMQLLASVGVHGLLGGDVTE